MGSLTSRPKAPTEEATITYTATQREPLPQNLKFEELVLEILHHEGGYVDNPKDPGGATNMGITQGTLTAVRGHSVSKAEVQGLTRAEATEIYRKNYWNPVRGDELPDGIALCVFDCAVNSGPSRAIKILQGVVGVKPDGMIGPGTLSAAVHGNEADIINAYQAARLTFMKSLSTWKSFGNGWTSRVAEVRRVALSMAS